MTSTTTRPQVIKTSMRQAFEDAAKANPSHPVSLDVRGKAGLQFRRQMWNVKRAGKRRAR